MSFQVIPTGGPMWNEPLSEMRMKALIAIDCGPLHIPREVTDYILSLERHYHDMRQDRNREFLETSWDARAALPADTSEGDKDGGKNP